MKQRKKQLLAFLLSIIFVVSSFAGLGLKVNAEERNIAYGYLYPNDEYYDYYNFVKDRFFKIGNGNDINQDYLLLDLSYDKVWAVPSEGLDNGNVAWVIDTGYFEDEYGDFSTPVYKPTRGKIEIGKNEVDASGNIVMTVEYDDEIFKDVNNLSYQWYVYDEKPIALEFKNIDGKPKFTDNWQNPVLINGKYHLKNKEWTTEDNSRYKAFITGTIKSQLLPDYELLTGHRSFKNTNTSIRFDPSALPLDIEADGVSFSTSSMCERWNDGQGTRIIPADSYEVLVYGIQKYERAIPGATGKTLTLPKTDPYYDINKQYYCVISEDAVINATDVTLVYSSRKANVKKDIDLSTCLVTVSDMPYTGKAIKPSVTVKNGNVTVDRSKYSVTYTNNTKVGTATATVKANVGSGFKGSKTVNFKITKAKNAIKVNDSIEKAVSSKNQSFNLNAKASFGSLTYKSNNKNVTVSKTGKVTIAKNFIGAAKITIDVKGTSNYSAASKAVNISVNPSKISVAKLTNPSKGAIKVNWKANEKLSGYEIQYTNDSKFKKTVKTVKINKATVNEKEIKSLKKGKTYYVRIRAYKTISGKKYYSDWSAAKSIKIKK